MAKTLKQLVEQKQRIVQGRFQPEPAKKDIHAHTIVAPQMAEDENLQEGRPDQRHPLEGHEYHKKSNAELIHIAKDAHKAAEAMKSHNTDAENKYRDQANDSATVRYFRQKSGMPNWYKKKYGHVNESTEQLDELSKKTLGSYVKSAYADKEVSATSASFKSGKAGDTHNTAQTSNREAKRDVGINKAMTRLTKEETLDELDTSTLQSYSKKAAKSNLINLMKPGEAARKTAAKRFSGMMKAGEKIANREVSKPTNEEFDLTEEQIEEIAGANMDTRAVHSHLKKRGWKLTRTSGGHDVYTHEKSPEHISVPRHKQLKAPLIMGILKSAKTVSEDVVEEQMANDPFAPPYAKKTGTYADRIAKNTATMAAKRQAGTIKPNVSLANTYGESRKASIVREAMKGAQERDEKKKEKKEVSKSGKDKFEPDPELSSDIIRHE